MRTRSHCTAFTSLALWANGYEQMTMSGGLERTQLALLDGRVVRLGFKKTARQKELLAQLLIQLLAQIGGSNNENAPFPFRPFLRKGKARFDGLAKADLISQQGAFRERRLEREARRINLMGGSVNSGAGHSAPASFSTLSAGQRLVSS